MIGAQERWWRTALLLGGALPLLGVFYFPLARLVSEVRGSWFNDWLSDPYYQRVLVFTYAQAFFSALLSALIGLPGAFLYAEAGPRVRSLLATLSLLPFSLPAILVAMGVISVWGKQGAFSVFFGESYEGIYGWTGILLAHTIFNFPLFIRWVGRSAQDQGRWEEMAALSLGASRTQCLFQVTLPKVFPSIVSAFFLCFLFCASSFLIVLLLGGGPRFTSIEVALYQAVKLDMDLNRAVGLGAFQCAFAAIVGTLVFRFRSAKRASTAGDEFHYLAPGKWRSTLFIAYLGCVGLLGGMPLVSLFWSGIRAISTEWVGPFVNSFTIGIATGTLALGMASCFQLGSTLWPGRKARQALGLFCTLPLVVSSVLVVMALRITYPMSPLSSWWSVVVVQSVMALPLVFPPVREASEEFGKEYGDTARSLGASFWQQWAWVEFPMMRRALLLAFLLGFGFSLGEAGTVMLFPSEHTETLTYALFQAMSRYRFDAALSMGAILLVLALVVMGSVAWSDERKRFWKV
jgi:thiamine transport system permease protein